MFTQRNYSLVDEKGTPIEREVQGSLKFRDSGLKSGSKLVLRPPQKDREIEAVDADEEGAIVLGEGGEDEMVEFEGGEDEMEGGESEMAE